MLAQQQIDDEYRPVEMRDPITRFLFKPDVNLGKRSVNNFLKGRLAHHNELTDTILIADQPLQQHSVPSSKQDSNEQHSITSESTKSKLMQLQALVDQQDDSSVSQERNNPSPNAEA